MKKITHREHDIRKIESQINQLKIKLKFAKKNNWEELVELEEEIRDLEFQLSKMRKIKEDIEKRIN